MSHPLVVHLKRSPYDVRIDRATKWGNPWIIGVHGDREDVIQKFAADLFADPERMAECRRELRGKVLGCWCAPLPCHGEILAEVANAEESG